MIEVASAELKQRGMKDVDKAADSRRQSLRPQAERRVRLGLVVAELVRANELQAKPEQIKAAHRRAGGQLRSVRPTWCVGTTATTTAWPKSKPIVIENNVTEFVLGKARRSTRRTVSFDELMATAARPELLDCLVNANGALMLFACHEPHFTQA
jgi:trigger factor